MNNNSNNENAILGVFSSAGYIDVGTKEKPLPYPIKDSVRSSFTGAQPVCPPAKKGLYGSKIPDVYLDKSHPWLMEGVKYQDRLKYGDTQKEKMKGFGTSDYSKRDEFSYDFRTAQHREALKMEAKHTQAATERAFREMQESMKDAAAAAPAETKRPKKLFYDLVFEDDAEDPEGLGQTAVPNSMIGGRVSNNPTQTSWGRDYGAVKTSSMACGYGIDTAHHGKPEHARVPIIEKTFYRPCAIPIKNTLYDKRPN